MPGHIVSSYDTDLEDLRRQISEMGGVAEKMTGEATLALARQDESLAQAVILADKRLDALQREIEEKAVLLIAKRQPMAVDRLAAQGVTLIVTVDCGITAAAEGGPAQGRARRLCQRRPQGGP